MVKHQASEDTLTLFLLHLFFFFPVFLSFSPSADTNHRLNLFYLANDVIQNCKRKNAIVYRSAFAEVLPNAALMVK